MVSWKVLALLLFLFVNCCEAARRNRRQEVSSQESAQEEELAISDSDVNGSWGKKAAAVSGKPLKVASGKAGWGRKAKYVPVDAAKCQARFSGDNQTSDGSKGVHGQTDKTISYAKGEKVMFCCQKGSKDVLIFTSHRFIHVDGDLSRGGKLVGAKPKVEYISYLYHVIDSFDVTTVGSFEFINADSELKIHFDADFWGGKAPEGCSGKTCKFDFHKSVDIQSIGHFVGSMLREKLITGPNAFLVAMTRPHWPDAWKKFMGGYVNKFNANGLGRLQFMSDAEAQDAIGKMLLKGEQIERVDGKLMAFNLRKKFAETDRIFFTNNRILFADRESAINAKTEIKGTGNGDIRWFPLKHPWGWFYSYMASSLIPVWSVKTAGKYDIDSELWFHIHGVGRTYLEFWKDVDTISLYQKLSGYALRQAVQIRVDGCSSENGCALLENGTASDATDTKAQAYQLENPLRKSRSRSKRTSRGSRSQSGSKS